MGKFDEYISSLDGKENIDPVVLASTLLELHNEEIATANAQISVLETDKQDLTVSLAEKDTALTRQMAANWQLANRVPTVETGEPQPEVTEKVGFDQFFKEE